MAGPGVSVLANILLHYHSNHYKIKGFTGGLLMVSSIIIMVGSRQHGAGVGAESFTSGSQDTKQREETGP